MNRYIRNMQLSGFGPEAQERLGQASVLVVGAGALGCIVAMYLAGAGIGRIGIVDFDNVDITNLQRQLSYTEADVGKPKAATLAAKVKAINSEIDVEVHSTLLRAADAPALIAGYDLVAECSDNPSTKYLVTDACVELGKPYVLGGVAQYQGQAMSWRPGHAAYRDFFPEGADADGYMPCSVGGVFGPLPGIVGSVMACEATKLAAGVGEPLLDRLLILDSLSMRFRTLSI